MPILGVSVPLHDIIEVCGPLTEADIWGVLCQGAEHIQDLFFRGEAILDGVPSFVVTPNTLLLCANGKVQFVQSSQPKTSAYFAPELHTGIAASEAAIEKTYVYSLGKTLQVTLENCSRKNPTLCISRNLECILTAMCEKNPSLRIALIHVLEACALQSQKRVLSRAPSFSQCVARLNKSVMGSQNELSSWRYDYYHNSSSDQSRQSTLNRSSLKSRKSCRKHKRRNPYQKKEQTDRSRSQSPARHTTTTAKSRRNVGQLDPEVCSNMERMSQIANHCTTLAQASAKPDNPVTPPSDVTSTCQSDMSIDSTSLTSSRHPASIISASDVPSHLAHTPAYGKYLQLKERQRKLHAVRNTPTEEGYMWASDTSDSYSDTRSVTSGISAMQGTYHPDMSHGYGTDGAFKLGPRGSDRDSIISSEMSFFQPEPNAMRSEADPSLPYAAPSIKAMTGHTMGSSSYNQIPRSPSSSILSSHGDDSFLNTKESNGPEFICRGRKPLIRLTTPLVGESVKNPGHARRVIIVLLNGQKLEAMCDPSMTGKQIYTALVSHMTLHEDIKQYFGLTYIHDGEHFFLENDTKLHKVAPDGWREGKKGPVALTFILFFRLKYYGSPNTTSIHFQHLLYLQLRQDILEERFECDENRALTLAAFALQVEYGSYRKEMMGRNYFVPEYYFSKRILNLYGLGFIRDHTPEAHRSICGLTVDDAMAKFIRLVQELPEYGSHFHKVYKTKTENPNSVCWIGVSSHSLILAENLKKERVIVERQVWDQVEKLSFKGKRVAVQLKPATPTAKSTKLHFYTNSHRKGRYLLQLSTDQHKFQLKMNQQLGIDCQDPKSVAPPPFADIEYADADDIDEENIDMVIPDPAYELQPEMYGIPVPMC
ncbi:tyrosine-protein phosphatase non-receptor type 13-like isoform X1 [Argonauta hians]